MPILPGIDYSVPTSTSPVTILDNQGSPITLFTINLSSAKTFLVNYSILRASTSETGIIRIATDGYTLSFEVDKTNNSDTGVTLLGTLTGSTIQVQYLSTSTGQNGSFKYFEQSLQ